MQRSNIPKYSAPASDEMCKTPDFKPTEQLFFLKRATFTKQAAAEGGCSQSFLRNLLINSHLWAQIYAFDFRETHQPLWNVHVCHCNWFFCHCIAIIFIPSLVPSYPSIRFFVLEPKVMNSGNWASVPVGTSYRHQIHCIEIRMRSKEIQRM